MRNLKKILALVLALMMTLSLMVTANASDYTDADQVSDDYSEAVEVLAGMGVFQGDDNGQFLPDATLNRKDAAALVYRVISGDVEGKYLNNYKGYAAKEFSDVSADAWYEPYVAYAANGNYIKGDGQGHFNPDADITGTEVLTILLRAVGYDQNNEFSKDWPVTVATLAKQLGVTDTVSNVLLTKAVSREVVAELIFRTITGAKMVNYTPAFGYQPISITGNYGYLGATKTQTLGQKVFALVGPVDTTDEWGRPGYKYTYNTGDKKTTFAYEADASYITRVDECDIAKDLGISKSATIESAWIDGEQYKTTDRAVTTNLVGTINPKATTSYVGAQGRQTYVYDMGSAGYRIVEINTYLAQVTKVTAEKTDKGGHVTPASVVFYVWKNGTPATYVYETDEFVKDQYALVTIVEPTNKNGGKDEGYIATADATAPVASGALKGYTISTTKVGEKTYDDADKFILNNIKTTANVGKNYDVFVDPYGNIIGMILSTNNYLVIEGIRWIHDGTVYGGYALADVILADGTRQENVTIATVNDTDVSNAANNGTGSGLPSKATVSDYYTGNNYYYDHLTTYSVNADGSYNIGFNTDKNSICFGDKLDSVIITKGLTTIKDSTNTNKVVANDNTVFLVADKPGTVGTTYTKYVGKNNVPNMTGATICYLTSSGYATVVLVTNYTLASNQFVAYVPTETTARQDSSTWYNGVYEGKYAYEVYKLGETTTTTIYSDNADLFGATTAGTNAKDGFYEIKVNAKGVVETATHFMGTYDGYDAGSPSGTYGTYSWDRAWVKTDLAGNSLQTSYSNLSTLWADYNVDNTTYLKVTKTTLHTGYTYTTVTGASTDEMVKGTKVIVAWNYNVAGAKTAAYVYVIDTEGSAVNPPAPATQGTVKWTVNFYDSNKSVIQETRTAYSDHDPRTYVYNTDYTAAAILKLVGVNTTVWTTSYCTPSITVTAGNTVEVVLNVYPNA